MRSGFHGSFSQPFQQVLLSHPCTQVTALAVSSVRIKFPFVPLFYEVISTIESDISLPLGLRNFFSMFVTLCVFQNLSQPGLQVFLGWMGCLQEGKIQGPRSGLPNYIKFPVWAAALPTPQVRADWVLLKGSIGGLGRDVARAGKDIFLLSISSTSFHFFSDVTSQQCFPVFSVRWIFFFLTRLREKN